ncbi:hypothetical protein Shyd_58900 [Streptomyces hydrogenans]|uniref:Uncharacterized protein n=1 Tax=Streptomyces hydrogenans TaxID=1873719 RepID=A0ABQ3PHM3_9ACTN|nr:hypothetical protein [Streptomyces hydrogenans]GHI24519.1 hypothetical protein Shyd_58900 [Streptomyces hydrogenans]
MTVRKSHGGVAERDWSCGPGCVSAAEQPRPLAGAELRVFRAGEVVEMVQWGRAGQEIDTGSWWTTNQYIPAAHIVPTDKVEVLEVLEEQRPTFEGEE